jgi:hypothetical protein
MQYPGVFPSSNLFHSGADGVIPANFPWKTNELRCDLVAQRAMVGHRSSGHSQSYCHEDSIVKTLKLTWKP